MNYLFLNSPPPTTRIFTLSRGKEFSVAEFAFHTLVLVKLEAIALNDALGNIKKSAWDE